FYVAAVQMPRGDSGQVKDAQYTWEKTLDGPEAKAIFVGSKAIIEGEIAALPSGKVARCEAFTKDATFSSPVAIHNYDCYVGAKITRIAFISGDGSVIKEWK
ncbi:MAG: hypothetical protein KKC14_09400, partial [Alphaproteobacteria bacterium]|nr:hypothetical protein [Alphaproteobacteria bacterium]